MKNKWIISLFSTFLAIGILSACNVNNNELNEQDEVDYQPVRYDDDTNTIDHDNSPAKKSFPHDEAPDQTDEEMEKGDDLEFDKNRGAD